MDDGKYRSIFHSPMSPADAFRAAHDEMRAWLRHKHYDLEAFDRGAAQVGPGAVLLHSAANSADGAQTERWQLREHKDGGAWVSSLTVHAPEGSAAASTWFWVEVEFEVGETKPRGVYTSAAVPRLARGLLAVVPAFDSLAALTDEPSVVSRERVDDLIDVLCDLDRRLPTVVASAHPGLDFEEWTRTVGRVTRKLPGLASIYILDPPGVETFEKAIGQTHAVWGGALRTYLPDVDPAIADEGLRHRVLSAARIESEPERAANILSVLPRRLAVEAPLPSALAGVNRILLTQARSTSGSTDAEGLRSQVAQLTLDLDFAISLVEQEQELANSLFAQRETALAGIAEREQRVLHLEGQVRALRHHLVEAGRYDEAFQPVAAPAAPPATFADLLDWLESELSLVDFTGQTAATLNLDQSPESPTWVRSAWEALRALQSFAGTRTTEAGRFHGDFKTWCENPPVDAYGIPAGKVARDESETVRSNARWRHQREFVVPAEVDVSKRVFMGAHIRIGASAGGQIAPRLYFYDATSQTGRIYVGYLGRHLTNTRT